ncbi:MAG TPA: Holliday junction resolvase RuvX [Thermoflexales bacterium]|nr:Holliday junction resolvase RuvX [Thermoflexales bacterium]HQW36436.1 Holliday junction resolvase RuvX [Thermoflexales bacterium]HQZ22848.1 Holliday junction resolvase RuvX [Thermoflexales bacterium]HRA01248.1 Holliday junction resolvase RuvX [Thermoflexales bacterium]
MARSICLDVGLRRVGVAVCDESKMIARPLRVLELKKGMEPAQAAQLVFGELARMSEYAQSDEVVIGYPLNSDGSQSEQTRLVLAFVDEARKLAALPIKLADERYSTAAAREIIGAKKRKKQDTHDDAHAAAIILQRYLDEQLRITNYEL